AGTGLTDGNLTVTDDINASGVTVPGNIILQNQNATGNIVIEDGSSIFAGGASNGLSPVTISIFLGTTLIQNTLTSNVSLVKHQNAQGVISLGDNNVTIPDGIVDV